MSGLIPKKDWNSLTLSQWGGPYNPPWTDDPTPPIEECPECGKEMKTDLDYWETEWEFTCDNPYCESKGYKWTETMLDDYYKTLRKIKHVRSLQAKKRNMPVLCD